MSDIAIRIEDLSKRYRIAALRYRHDTLREQVLEGLRSVLSRTGGPNGRSVNIWALRNVSFEVKQGEVIGIIGRNGAGKSTLLKILSRITEPTYGRVEMHGRFGSLLEVGTGFDRDLTGRENIYLSGAILGMRRAEIHRKFDEIVSFAEIEKFIDTPVKRYSSGMYVRLAFAVAAHLEPEILIVDEVLAVGDTRFQKKCLSKMSDFGRTGRTILFVSHSMSAITRLCERTILLDQGRVLEDGPADKVVGSYLNSGSGTTANREWLDPTTAPQGKLARLFRVCVRSQDGRPIDSVDIRESIHIDMEYDVLADGRVLMPILSIQNNDGVQIFTTVDLDPDWQKRPRPSGRYVSTVLLPGNFLTEGLFFVNTGLCTLDPYIHEFYEKEVVAFKVVEGPGPGSARGSWHGEMRGVVRPVLNWTTSFTPDVTGVRSEGIGP